MLKALRRFGGFTLIELMIVMVVMSTLLVITYSYAVPKYRERTYLTRATSELHTLADALTLYVSKYNDYPAETNRGIPPGIQEFLQQNYNNTWPNAPWPGSTYDYDNWTDPNTGSPIIQMSIRFCNVGDTATCKKQFPAESWVTSSWDSYSAVYYCVRGACRSDISKPVTWPGRCINCTTSPAEFH
jgi:prepilin-type N-terminal cleavage/methylation domain-containing protein